MKSYHLPDEFKEIDQKLANENNEEKKKLLKKESEKYDYAILILEEKVKREKYPMLYPNFKQPEQSVRLSGYTK